MFKIDRNVNCFAIYIAIGLILLSFHDSCDGHLDALILKSNLAECYRRENSVPIVPQTLQVLLEIVRKIENETKTAGDLLLISAKLLHHLRMDGVQKDASAAETEFVIPYSPSGLMAQKFAILLNLISNVETEFKIEEYLTKLEYCTLHKLISTTVESVQRGDEYLTCRGEQLQIPANRAIKNEYGRDIIIPSQTSRCPIEGGVIRTRGFGTISPGILIASIAAGLQTQAVQLREMFSYMKPSQRDVETSSETIPDADEKQTTRILFLSTMNDRINNTFASNLAGDLAEVCVFQSAFYTNFAHVGAFGYWNNVEYPLSYYLNDSNYLNWFMTDSEILAGIDGYYLANNIRYWQTKMPSLRLSQLLEMYYSKKGIPSSKSENSKKRQYWSNDFGGEGDYDDRNSMAGGSACYRKNFLRNIEVQKLKYETYLFAKVLQYTANTPQVEENALKFACDLTVDTFFKKSSDLLKNLKPCKSSSKPIIDATLVVDGSRNQSENYKLISQIAEIIDITPLTSKLSVVNGMSGQYMIKSASSVVKAFEHLKNFSGKHPTGLSLSESLKTIIFSLQNSSSIQNSSSVGLPVVIVIVSQSQKLLDNDFYDAKRLIEGSLQYSHDIYFVFITNDAPRFQDLIADLQPNPMNPKNKYSIIESENLDTNEISINLLRKVKLIPKWLRPLSCEFSDYEDYIGTEQRNHYRINSYEIKNHGKMIVQFQVAESYGIIIVCKSLDEQSSECVSSKNSVSSDVWFEIDESCADETHCPAINFMVDLYSTNERCSETSCRYPDDVRYNVRIKRDQCNSAVSMKSSFSCYLLSFIVISIIYLFQK